MLDKLKVYTTDFKVGKNAPLQVKQGVLDCLTGEVKGISNLYTDQAGQEVSGASAYMNTDHFNLDISNKGLFITFTPAKVLFGNNFYSVTSDQNKIVCQQIQQELEQNDIHLNLGQSKLSRVDIAKNAQTKQPFSVYNSLFSLLTARRMTPVSYGETHSFRNESREVLFYDKLYELTQQGVDLKSLDIPKSNVMRSELRLRSHRVVKRDTELDQLDQLYSREVYEDLRGRYKKIIADLVFHQKEGQDKVVFNYSQEVELLLFMKEKYSRNAIMRYLSLTGLENVLQVFGSLENFRKVLLGAGFERSYVWRQVRDLEENLKFKSQVKSAHRKDSSISALYEELYSKFVA